MLHISSSVYNFRQSTSDDARLLRELEKEAESKIKKVIYGHLEDLNFDYAIIHENPSRLGRDCKIKIKILFKINCKEFCVDSEFDAIDSVRSAIANKLCEITCEKIREAVNNVLD